MGQACPGPAVWLIALITYNVQYIICKSPILYILNAPHFPIYTQLLRQCHATANIFPGSTVNQAAASSHPCLTALPLGDHAGRLDDTLKKTCQNIENQLVKPCVNVSDRMSPVDLTPSNSFQKILISVKYLQNT